MTLSMKDGDGHVSPWDTSAAVDSPFLSMDLDHLYGPTRSCARYVDMSMTS